VLQPEYTILITAKPDVDDLKAFELAMQIAELQRVSVKGSASSYNLIRD
jgi:hypothetical protein